MTSTLTIVRLGEHERESELLLLSFGREELDTSISMMECNEGQSKDLCGSLQRAHPMSLQSVPERF